MADERTVDEARADDLRRARSGEENVECSCCGRGVGYKQALERTHILELYRLFRRAALVAGRHHTPIAGKGGRLVHVPSELGRGASNYSMQTISVSARFGLCERVGDQRGLYRITSYGRNFLLGRVGVPTSAWIVAGEVVQLGGSVRTIDDFCSQAEREHWILINPVD